MSTLRDRLTTFPARKLLVVFLIIAAFAMGYYVSRPNKPQPTAAKSDKTHIEDDHDHGPAKPAWWTCSMHPQIKLPAPGKCPICYMDLIPMATGEESGSEGNAVTYTMSETAKKLAEVETVPVVREKAKLTVRMVGLVYEDETKQASLTSRVDGRLDEMYITFTGWRYPKAIRWSKSGVPP
jgi:membrane fusion protein, copper/silver efflux system